MPDALPAPLPFPSPCLRDLTLTALSMPRSSHLVSPACPRPRRGPGRSLAVAWVWGLLLALFWSQMLGLVHSVRHVHGLAHAPGVDIPGEDGGRHLHPVHVHADAGVLGHLQAPADDAQDCRLYDQLGHAGPVSAPFGLLVHALPLVPAWVVLQSLQPRACVPFEARAPPVSR